MKRLFLTLTTVLLLSTPTQASSLIVYGGNLSDDDKIAIDGLMREYTGPAAAHFINNPTAVNDPQFALLFSDEPFAEEKFMRNMLQAKYPEVKVEAIPTTLWDTTVAMLWLTDRSLYEKYNQMKTNKNSAARKKDYLLRYFDISAEIGNNLEAADQKLKKFKAMTLENLKKIKEQRISSEREASNAFIHEYDNIIAGKGSLLLELIDEEYEAAKNNQFIIVRATGGAQLTVPPDFIPAEADLMKKINFEKYNGMSETAIQKQWHNDLRNYAQAKIGMRENNKKKWQYNDNDNRRVIDFQTSGLGIGVFGNIAGLEEIIKDKNLKNSDLMTISTNFSYATSLLGGILHDSFNRKVSACSFVFYSRGQTDIVYTLLLDKKWLYTQGRNMFYFADNGLYTDATFGAQESFHPRLLSISPSNDDDDDNNFQEIGTKTIGLDQQFSYGEFKVGTENEALKKTTTIILQQLVKNAELLTHARIMALGKNVFSKPNETAEAQELIANQKVALETLLEHIRK